MGRHKGYHLPPVPVPDHSALFVQAGLRITRNAGLLDAYRKATGLYLKTIRTHQARESLKQAIARTHGRFSGKHYYTNMSAASENAGRGAMCEYLAHWWTCTLCDQPPDIMGEGDEWFSRATVRLIVEEWRDAIPDRVG